MYAAEGMSHPHHLSPMQSGHSDGHLFYDQKYVCPALSYIQIAGDDAAEVFYIT